MKFLTILARIWRGLRSKININQSRLSRLMYKGSNSNNNNSNGKAGTKNSKVASKLVILGAASNQETTTPSLVRTARIVFCGLWYALLVVDLWRYSIFLLLGWLSKPGKSMNRIMNFSATRKIQKGWLQLLLVSDARSIIFRMIILLRRS